MISQNDGKLESATKRWRTIPNRGKNPKRNLSGRLTLASAIFDSNDATQFLRNSREATNF